MFVESLVPLAFGRCAEGFCDFGGPGLVHVAYVQRLW
jgi:hypothetical protein